MTNRERVLALITSTPGLTDTEIRERTGIRPHQQVNQLCRSLALEGWIRRTDGPSGRIINFPAAKEARADAPEREVAPKRDVPARHRVARNPRSLDAIKPLRLGRSMVVIACSGTKAVGDSHTGNSSISALLPEDLRQELSARRTDNVSVAGIDESTLLPAANRYDGNLYRKGRSAIRQLMDAGALVIIISGGYGVVTADELIGRYNCTFDPKMWRPRLIERCLAGVATLSRVESVIGVLSATTNYAKVFRRTQWPSTAKQAFLASPEATTGAMVKAPRAQGEFLEALTTGSVPSGWESSDGLGIVVTDYANL